VSRRPPPHRYALYEEAVQDTGADIDFITRVFRRARQRPPLSLREDFCGTAKLCADWVASRPDRRAIGLDLDAEPLAYGRAHHLAALGADARRVTLHQRDVLDGTVERSDVIVAFNFSYFTLRTRAQLLRYFATVHRDLEAGGGAFFDIYGGPEAQSELREKQRRRGFVYVWEQGPLDAVSNTAERAIHFRLADGTTLERAFSYEWRMWALPEVRDVLYEAGFSRVDVYWEGANRAGEGTGEFRKVRAAVNELAWVAYVVAWR